MRKKFMNNILVFATLGGGLCGYILAFIAGFMPIYQKQFGFTSAQISVVAGSILLGCVISSVYTGFLNDLIGRKKVMLITLIFCILGSLGFVIFTSFHSIYIFRLLQGIGFGMAVIVIPVYLSEISSKERRGIVITTFQLSLTGGVLISNLINLIMAAGLDWHFISIILLSLSCFVFYYATTLPESPRWIFNHSDSQKAKLALNTLNERFDCKLGWEEINIVENKEKINIFTALTTKSYIVPILIVTAAVSLNQLSGINAFLQCSISILHSTGINSDIVGLLGGLTITIVNFIATILTLIFVEKIGRKKILMIGTFTMLITLLALSGFNFFMPNTPLKGYIVLLGIILVVGFFAFGPGGVILVLCTELLPNKVRGIGISIAFTVGGLVGMFFVSSFLPIGNKIGYSGLFLLIAFFVLCYLFIALIIPETKGKSLEEIEQTYKK